MGYVPSMALDYLNQISSAVGTALLVALGVYALVGLYTVVAYVMGSLGVYTLAVNRGIKHPWLAWLPYGNLWILGSIADQYQYVSFGSIRSRRKVLLGLQIAITALGLALLGGYVYAIAEVLIRYGGNPTYGAIQGLIPLGLGMVAVCTVISMLNFLLLVFRYICLYNLFASCRPKCKVAFLLLSILLCPVEPFLVFACRNKEDGMPPRKIDPLYTAPSEFDL